MAALGDLADGELARREADRRVGAGDEAARGLHVGELGHPSAVMAVARLVGELLASALVQPVPGDRAVGLDGGRVGVGQLGAGEEPEGARGPHGCDARPPARLVGPCGRPAAEQLVGLAPEGAQPDHDGPADGVGAAGDDEVRGEDVGGAGLDAVVEDVAGVVARRRAGVDGLVEQLARQRRHARPVVLLPPGDQHDAALADREVRHGDVLGADVQLRWPRRSRGWPGPPRSPAGR
jgi:hypothetical protein